MLDSVRSCQGGRRQSFIHDATACPCCVHTNFFYTIFRPALERLKKLNNCSSSSDDYEVCGILTFLEGCLRFGYITGDAATDISPNGNPPDYTPLLDSIVNTKKKFSSRPGYSASIRALLYKYKKKALQTNETKQSVPNQDFDNCLEESSSGVPCEDDAKTIEINETKRRVPKRHFHKDPTPALLNKRTRKALKTNEARPSVSKSDFDDKESTSDPPCKDDEKAIEITGRKRRVSKRHSDKRCKDPIPALLNKRTRKALKANEEKKNTPKRQCPKNPTPALLNKHKKRALKTNKTRQSVKKNQCGDRTKHPVSSARKKKSKAPTPSKAPSSKKVADKIPTKGTLKRKRWYVKQLETEANYEDDIFENSPIYRLAKFDEASQSSMDSSQRCVTPTWEFKLSPRPESPLPDIEDSGNIEELRKSRKEAEEYQHLRKKRRKDGPKNKPQKTSAQTETKKDQPVSSEVAAMSSLAQLMWMGCSDVAQPSCSNTTINPSMKDEDTDYLDNT